MLEDIREEASPEETAAAAAAGVVSVMGTSGASRSQFTDTGDLLLQGSAFRLMSVSCSVFLEDVVGGGGGQLGISVIVCFETVLVSHL